MSDPTSGFRTLSPGFHNALEALAERPGWWRDVLAQPDLILAVRRESLNVYHRGASIVRVGFPNGMITAETHVKYLLRQRQAMIRLDTAGTFAIDPTQAVWTSYAGPATLTEMMRAAAPLAGLEKTGLHRLVLGAPNVIDVEIALTRAASEDADIEPGSEGSDADATLLETDAAPGPSPSAQDRLDVASLEERGEAGEAWLALHEAKLAANPELRARPGNEPAIVRQIERYTTTLTHEADRLVEGYRVLCGDLVRLDALRRRVSQSMGSQTASPRPLDPLIAEVASGTRRLRVDPQPRLVVFGFDADQRDGALRTHLDRLRNEFGLTVRAVGNPSTRGANVFRRLGSGEASVRV